MSAFAITLFTRAICADGVERVEASSALGSFSGWPELSGFAFTAPSGLLTKLGITPIKEFTSPLNAALANDTKEFKS